jgi:hypothetical protein
MVTVSGALFLRASSEVFRRIPSATEQGIISVEQRTSLTDQGSSQAKQSSSAVNLLLTRLFAISSRIFEINIA